MQLPAHAPNIKGACFEQYFKSKIFSDSQFKASHVGKYMTCLLVIYFCSQLSKDYNISLDNYY